MVERVLTLSKTTTSGFSKEKLSGGVSLLEVILFFMLTLTNWGLAAFFVSGLMSLTSLALFVWMTLILFRLDQAATALASAFLLNRMSVIVSLVFIEFGGYIPELGRYGEPGVGAASFVFYSAAMFFPYIYIIKFFFGKPSNASYIYRSTLSESNLAKFIAFSIILICVLCTFYLLAFGAATGFPLFTNTDRFVYRTHSANLIVVSILGYKSLFGMILGAVVFLLAVPKTVKLLCLGIFVIQIFTFFLFGDKFFTIATNFAFFFAPYFIAKRRDLSKVFKYVLPIGAVVCALLFAITFVIYSDGLKRSPAETMDKVSGRVTGQGELWYVTTKDEPKLVAWDQELVEKTIQSLTERNPAAYEFSNGISSFYLAYKYAPSDLALSMQRNNGSTSFTMALEPLGLVMYGYLGLILMMMATGAFVAISVGYLQWALRSISPLSIIIAGYVLIQVLYTTNQASPPLIFNIYRIKFLLLFVALELSTFIFVGLRQMKDKQLRAARLTR